MDLSVIVIARNEEKTIGACLDSVKTAADKAVAEGVVRDYEIIFVDSASTDKTLDVACARNIICVALPADWPLSPAAGLYNGSLVALGNYLAVVDGDCTLHEDWYVNAVPYLRADINIAGVYGWWVEQSVNDRGGLSSSIQQSLDDGRVSVVTEAEFIGNSLYRKKAVDDVGGFNPYLKGAEDKDLSYRLRLAGYKLLIIPAQIGWHDWSLSYLEYFRSIRGWSLGDGHAYAFARNSGFRDLAHLFKAGYSSALFFRVLKQTLLIIATLVSSIFIIGNANALTVSIGVLIWLVLLMHYVAGARYFRQGHSKYFFHYFMRIPYVSYRYWCFYLGSQLPTPAAKSYPRLSGRQIHFCNK